MPDEVKAELAIQRNQGGSSLTQIAEQLPQKLSKLKWDSLAERICGAAQLDR